MRYEGIPLPDAIEWIADRTGIVVPNGKVKFSGPRTIVAEYDYRGPAGELRYQVVRFQPKDFRQRRPNGSGWIWSISGVDKVLYRLPELLASSQRKWVLLVEGEKDVDRLRSLGFVATTNAMGAGKWEGTYTEQLVGRRVIILPDNDHPGMAHAFKVANEIYGNAAEVRVIELPGLGERVANHGADVSDWLDNDHNSEELKALIRASANWQPAPGETTTIERRAVTRDDFRSYMPDHRYIFMPTRELWAAASVDGRLGAKTSQWLDRNRPVEQMTWAPGQPMLIEHQLMTDGGLSPHEGVVTFNQYRPADDLDGDAALAWPWLDHVSRLYPNEHEEIIRWLAQRVQHPETKINHGIVLGGGQGIGKDTIVEPVKYAVGSWNVAEVSPMQLLGRFNGFVRSVILRVSEARDLGENEQGANRYSLYEHMKIYMAAPPHILRCDLKHAQEFSVLNVCGVVITTNHKTGGIYLPPDDRRHFVAWSDLKAEQFEPDYWTRLYDWFEEGGGYGHVSAYLHSLDISTFNPKDPPRKTSAFWDVVEDSRQPEDSELADILDERTRPPVVTLKELIDYASSDLADWLRDRRNSRKIPHRLEAVGYVKVRNAAAKDGQWKVNGKRQAIYARADLSETDRIQAAQERSEYWGGR